MNVVSGNTLKILDPREVDGDRGRQSAQQRLQIVECGLAEEQRPNRVAAGFDQPADDEPAFGDEEMSRANELRIGEASILRDAWIVRPAKVFHHAIRQTAGGLVVGTSRGPR